MDLPWERVEKDYRFEGPDGSLSLADLFGDCSQLIVYHFMLGPEWEEGCKSCSLLADHYNGTIPHLKARDVSMVTVSRAPLDKIEAFKTRMGWTFPWVSSHGSDFNMDYQVSFTPQQLEAGKVYYNYAETTFPPTRRPASARSAKTPTVRSTTPIRPMRAASTSSSPPTTCSTSRPRAATSRTSTSRWNGSATTTGTRIRPPGGFVLTARRPQPRPVWPPLREALSRRHTQGCSTRCGQCRATGT